MASKYSIQNQKIKKIKCSDLVHYFESIKDDAFQPISENRVQSYINNPFRQDFMPVLYLLFIDDKPVGYRSVLQDILTLGSENNVIFVWLSGTWTDPNYRNLGISSLLLDEVMKDYEGLVFSTGLWAASQAVLEKRQDIRLLKTLNARRFYYRFPLAEVLPPSSGLFRKIKPILKAIDFGLNSILDLRFRIYTNSDISGLEKSKFDTELQSFISKHNSDSLFKRNIDDFRWIRDYPWVTQRVKDEGRDADYYFTTSARRFKNEAFTLIKEDAIVGFLSYSIRSEVMKVHYIFCKSANERSDFAKHIKNIIRKEKISYLITSDDKLIHLIKKSGGYLFSKLWKKTYFAGSELLDNHTEMATKDIFMGDGDTIFT